MTQRVERETRLQDGELSILDLLFAKNVELGEGVIHECLLRKNDHEL